MELPPNGLLNLERARAGVTLGPEPSWVLPCSFDLGYREAQPTPATYLLVDRQVNAETRQSYLHQVMRLETMQAVQHAAQWSLPFDPRTQSVVLHSLKVKRGEAEFDQAKLERFHFLQREQGLEGLTLDGWITALLVLEDIRPGDILDYSYTIETRPLLLGRFCTELFLLPTAFPIGKFRFSVCFDASRQLAWKGSSADLHPTEEVLANQRRMVWSGQERTSIVEEERTPAWHRDYPWIQVSDCPDWKTIGIEVAKVWQEGTDSGIEAAVQEIKAQETETLKQVELALRLVQDQHRYLSHNIELGGQIPTAPGVVARRRFGDCKDLSFLLVHLLKGLGLAARPILVSTKLSKGLRTMLPSAGLFDHVIVEFRCEGQVRWVDATIKNQGGGPLKRALWPLECGLPIDADCEGLVEPPRQQRENSPYELRETLLLGTEGKSVLDVRLHVRGLNADQLRDQIESAGLETLARERLEICTKRFGNAARLGNLQYHDERMANEMVLAEAFEVDGFLGRHPDPQLRVFALPANLPASILPIPADAPRRTPFALPYPCDMTHTFYVESPALPSGSWPKADVENGWLKFARRQRSINGQWSFTFSLQTLDHAVPAKQVGEHRKLLEKIWQESSFNMVLPAGHRRPNRTNLGQLPVVKTAPSAAAVLPNQPPPQREPRHGSDPTSPETATPLKSKSRRRSRARKVISRELPAGEGRFLGKLLIALFVIVWLAIIAFITLTVRFKKWH
jgi:hypothetical protein